MIMMMTVILQPPSSPGTEPDDHSRCLDGRDNDNDDGDDDSYLGALVIVRDRSITTFKFPRREEEEWRR